MTRDILVLVLSYVYLFIVLGITELLRRRRGYSVDFTRKAIHIAAGMTAYFLLFFENRWIGIIPSVSFIFINALSYWKGAFLAMETGERGQLGTIYFPISFTVVAWLLWHQRPLVVAAVMPMTWGDAFAAVVGRRWGHRKYTILGSSRSLEGSAVFLLTAWISTALPLALLSASPFSGLTAVLVALGMAAAATLVEAVSPWGTDNLTVPAVSTLALVLACGYLGIPL
jgi:phytol kinase